MPKDKKSSAERSKAFLEKMRVLRDRAGKDGAKGNGADGGKDGSSGKGDAGDFKGGHKGPPFMPFLLIRTMVGDKGARPLDPSIPVWESPDIWTWQGSPASAPDLPPNVGGTVVAGSPNTVYAHVWNLGRAPIGGCLVEWFWFNPSFGFNSVGAHAIGQTTVDLSPRGYPGCHKLVKCPGAWVPVMENQGHECVVARVSGLGDPLVSVNNWNPDQDRHLAQRNLAVIYTMAQLANLLGTLEAGRMKGTVTRLYQVGKAAKHALALVAPDAVLDPTVHDHLLAEIDAEGRLFVHGDGTVGRIAVHALLAGQKIKAPGSSAAPKRKVRDPHEAVAAQASIKDLFHHTSHLHPADLSALRFLPKPGQAQARVLRLVNLQKGQVVGGYTLVFKS